MYYSAQTGGFYDAQFHGARKLLIVDPAFIWPQISIKENGESILINDPAISPPMIEVDNPDTKIPADAVEITPEWHAVLISGQASGMRIVADQSGHPVLDNPAPPTPEQQRAATVAAINETREVDLLAGVEIDGKRYHTDDRFLTELLGLVLGFQAGLYTGAQAIRTMDNQIVQLNVTQITALAAAVGEHRKAVYAASWAAKDALQ